jgi:transcriptional regulator with XRE-family HTH domain
MAATNDASQAADLTVAAEIRAELGRQRLSQADLARRLGVSRPWVSRRLSGQTALSIPDIARIAHELGVAVTPFVAPVDDHE